jgi:hypothetical protein
MILKKHVDPSGQQIIAICDSDIACKRFEENNTQLDLSSDFYKGDKISPDKLISMIRKAYVINAVGQKTIDLLIKECLLTEENIKYISGIPYAMVVIDKEQ